MSNERKPRGRSFGQYLGRFGANPYVPDSTSNRYGRYEARIREIVRTFLIISSISSPKLHDDLALWATSRWLGRYESVLLASDAITWLAASACETEIVRQKNNFCYDRNQPDLTGNVISSAF